MVQSDHDAQVKAFAAASQMLHQWYVGAQALALLRAADRAGLLRLLRGPRAVPYLATQTCGSRILILHIPVDLTPDLHQAVHLG